MKGYVYHRQFVAAEDINKIIEDVKKCSNLQDNYYFVRYSHTVSSICMKLPDDREQIEGQMFNATCELRWKKQKTGYEALILSKQKFEELEDFKPVSGDWIIRDHNAYWHTEEPKFPKGFKFKGKNNQHINSDDIKVQQRYFQDSDTATVHFVALTVKEK